MPGKENLSAENPNGLNFKDYITLKMQAVEGMNGHTHATAAEMAATLGISTKVFQEILNGRRSGPDRRDLVIALCAQLGLDASETSEALRLYPGMVRGLSRDDARDRAIAKFLNAGFDTEISYVTLDSFLTEQSLPGLKIRYRNPSQNENERSIPMKQIDWSTKSSASRVLYKYYTRQGYDEMTASVLTLFTYGDKVIPDFSIRDAYEALANGTAYPPPPPPPEGYDCDNCKLMRTGVCSGLSCMGFIPAGRIDPETLKAAQEAMGDLYSKSHSGGKAKYASRRTRESACERVKEQSVSSARSDLMKRDYKLPMMDKAKLSRDSLPSMYSRPFIPLADTDDYEPIVEKGQQPLAANATSTFRMTTNTASVGIVLNQLRNGRTITRDMVRIEEWLNYFRYDTVKPEEEMFRISHEVRDREDGKKMLYVNVQGREEEKENQNIVLLLDVSGSMRRNAEMTQAAVATILGKLKPGCTLSLVTYGPSDNVILDGYPISSYENKLVVLEKLLGLQIGGYTDGSAGIERAYEVGRRNYIPGGNNQVILITDGDLNFGIVSKGGLETLIEEEKKSNLFLSVLGIGLTNFKDDKLEVLCKHGNGVYRVINNLVDVKKCVSEEYASLVNIIAKDVKAQVEFNPELVRSFRLLGFENRELSHADFRDDKVISEPFGSGGYGVALYELCMKEPGEALQGDLKYRRVVTTGSEELATVKVRYKEPLEDASHELEHVIPSAEEHYTDNLILASIVYVCAEKLRDSDKITLRDEALAQAALDELGKEIVYLNYADIRKLQAILQQSKQQLNVGSTPPSRFHDW